MCGLFSPPRARSFRVEGKQVVCPHCNNILFRDRKALLNSSGSELLGAAWMDHSAFVLICANCSRMEWFHDADLVKAEDS